MDPQVDYRPPVLVGWEGPGGADERERLMRAVRAGVRRGMALAAARSTHASGGLAPAAGRDGVAGFDPASGLHRMPSYQGDGETISIPVSVPGDAAPPAPQGVADVNGTSGYIRMDHYAVPVTPAGARQYMRVVAFKEGVDAARYLAASLRMQRTALGIDGGLFLEPTPQMRAAVRAYATVNDALEAERAHWDEFLRAFEERARVKGQKMLAISEKWVTAERDRYGLTRSVHYRGPATFGMADNQDTSDLATSARLLLDALAPLQRALSKLEDIQVADLPGTWEFDIGLRPEPPDPAELAAREEEVRQAQEAYSLVRNEQETFFPVLASFAGYDVLHTYDLRQVEEKLEKVARGAKGGQPTAALVAGDVFEKLKNIATVRAGLADGDLNIWGADNLVGVVKVELGIAPGTLADKIVMAKVDSVTSAKSLRNLMIGVFAFALGLLAAPLTGGGSLGVAAGIVAGTGSVALSAGLAIAHFQEYQLSKAANATDFVKARVISSEEPSLFWLALDIVGVVLDVHAAMRAFGSLARFARPAVSAGDDAAKAALDALEQAAAVEVKDAPQLGKTVRRAVERERVRVRRTGAAGPKYYHGGGGGVRKGMHTGQSMSDVEVVTARTTLPDAVPALTESERAMVAEAEQAAKRLGRPLKVKTKAAAEEGAVQKSGFGKEGGGEALTREVMNTGDEIGHTFARNTSMDGGVPGMSAASHAEKLTAMRNPGKALGVDRVMCDDCYAFFQRLARARRTSIVIHEPNQTWVFRPDGSRVGLSSETRVVIHPDGSASASPLR